MLSFSINSIQNPILVNFGIQSKWNNCSVHHKKWKELGGRAILLKLIVDLYNYLLVNGLLTKVYVNLIKKDTILYLKNKKEGYIEFHRMFKTYTTYLCFLL
jgi:hypothetical protein